MKKYLQFIFSFLFISLVLYFLIKPVAFCYQFVLVAVMLLFTSEIVNYYYDSSFRLIILISILLATPGIPIKKRLLFSLYGVLSLWAIDLISFAIWTTPPQLMSGIYLNKPHLVYSLTWRMMGHWVIPFLLWIMMIRDRFQNY